MKKRKILHALIYAVLTLGALLVFFPFYLTVVSSLKDMSDIFSNFFGLPRHIVFDNFAYVLQRPDYFIALKNSAIITGVAIVAMVFFLPMCAYAISRRRFTSRFYSFLYFFMVAGIFIPFQVKMLPMVKLMSNIGLLNRTGAILFYIANSTCEGIFLLVGYLASMPTDLEEAAYIDGAGFYRTFFVIVFPLAKSGLATGAILQFLTSWNEFMFGLVLTKSTEVRTLPLALNYFTSQFSFNYTAMFAALTMVILPCIVIYVLLQEQVTTSMVAGSVKG
mgnify:CR=1 FL=1